MGFHVSLGECTILGLKSSTKGQADSAFTCAAVNP